MSILSIIGGLLGGLKFGKESFSRTSKIDTEAESQDLDPEMLKILNNLFAGQVGGKGFGNAQDAFGGRLAQLMGKAGEKEFDVNAFASGITKQATAGAQLDLESQINGMLSKSGSSEGGNSMNALLANKLRNVTAANLAGITSQATATGEGIRQSQQAQITEGIGAMGGALSQNILQLIMATRGASQRGKSKTTEVTSGKGKNSSFGGFDFSKIFGGGE